MCGRSYNDTKGEVFKWEKREYTRPEQALKVRASFTPWWRLMRPRSLTWLASSKACVVRQRRRWTDALCVLCASTACAQVPHIPMPPQPFQPDTWHLQDKMPVTRELHETLTAMLGQMNKAIDALPDLTGKVPQARR